MPYVLFVDNVFYDFDKLNQVPKDFYEKTISIEASGMNLRSINNIGLKFPNLEQLDVGLNNIKILDLSYFHNLKILRCNKSNVREIIGFEYCHKLEEVELNMNKIKTISSNNNIKSLSLGLNYLINLPILPDFPNLVILNVAGTTHLTSLGRMPKLKELYIYNCNVEFLDTYMELEKLDCSRNYSIKTIYPYPKLKELICSYSNIKKLNLPYLPSLEYLQDK